MFNIKKLLTMFYYKVDVMGKNGYSFMVQSTEELDELDVIHKAYLSDLFNDAIDLNYAMVDDLVDETDVEHFKSCGCLHNIS